MVVAAAASVAGAATRAALLRASRVPATAPRPAAGERLAMASVEPTSSVASDDASAGLAASLVAHYVVERYVTEHLAQAAPALTMVAATHPATITSAGFESDL